MPVRSLTAVIVPEFYAEYGGIDTMTSTPLRLSFVDYSPSHSSSEYEAPSCQWNLCCFVAHLPELPVDGRLADTEQPGRF